VSLLKAIPLLWPFDPDFRKDPGKFVGDLVNGPKPPAAPDLAGAAREQATLQQQAVDQQTQQNRPDQVNMFGFGTRWTTGPDGRPVQTQTASGPMANALNSLMGQVGSQQPFSFGSLGAMPQALQPGGGGGGGSPLLGMLGGGSGGAMQQWGAQPSTGNTMFAQGGGAQMQAQGGNPFQVADPRSQQLTPFSFGGAPSYGDPRQMRPHVSDPTKPLPSMADPRQGLEAIRDPRTAMLDPQQARDQAIGAAYGQATSRLDPQFQQREQAMRAQLVNQGLDPTSEAFRTELDTFNRGRNDAYGSAMNSAIMQGTEAGNALFRQGLDQNAQHLGAQNQMFGQSVARDQMNLGAQNQFFGQGLAANNQALSTQGQMFGQNMALNQQDMQNANDVFGRYLQGQGQQFGQGLAQNAQDLQAQQQGLNYGLNAQGQAFDQGMRARQQGAQELMTQHQMPWQQLGQLFGFGGQQGFNSAGVGQAPDLLGAAMGQGALDMSRFNTQRDID
jgi:hypothetical protein